MQDTFRQAMSSVAASVTVITTSDSGGAHATTVSAFASLSMNPPMIMFALDCNSELLARLQDSKRAGVNILAEGQGDVALACARKGAGKMDRIPWVTDHGLPRIKGALAFLACQDVTLFPGGDHLIVTARVSHVALSEQQVAPCVYFRCEFASVARAC
jgi:flavin reductase (DIM6/NTAB) family NADH-FMN oxidoreductase RutF